MSTQAQLRIAARIHYALKHLLGEGIDVGAMLNSPAQAREVLFVCQASGNDELMMLAHRFVVAGQLAAIGKSAARQTDAPQAAAWARNTSGFGVSQAADLLPGDMQQAAPQTHRTWLRKPAWLRRDQRK